MSLKQILSVGLCLALMSCSQPATDEAQPPQYDRSTSDMPITAWIDQQLEAGEPLAFKSDLDAIGVDFIKLALLMGQLDGDYVDAYSGPKIWHELAASVDVKPEGLAADIKDLRERVDALEVEGEAAIRKNKLSLLLRAMAVRLDVVSGKSVAFDTEVSEIYDVIPPVYDLKVYDQVLADIDALLPGEGTVADKVTAFRNSVAIPKDKLKPVFDRAISECRARTQKYFDLPDNEKFVMEFVSDKSWSGYNYYQGGYESLIQINTDFPITIERAVDLGCHEGYPGHHVWNLLVERELLHKRGWVEYSVNPLFGPFGPMAEGTGNYGIILAFPGHEKIEFEKEVLFPMAGLDPDKADMLTKLLGLEQKLKHATNEVARQYLDGQITREEAIPMIQKYYLQSREKSEQRIRFVEKYRGYVINYNIGLDMAKDFVEAAGDDPKDRWDAFHELLTRPVTASDIQSTTP